MASAEDAYQRLLDVAVLASDVAYLQTADTPMTEAERTSTVVQGAVTYLVDHGLLIVPDDLAERLRRAVSC